MRQNRLEAGMKKTKNPILNGELVLESKLPIYHQLMMIIKRGIALQNIKPGDKLPTESELCEAYSVSRSTVRSTFRILEDEGLIYRVRGRGTFISNPRLRIKSQEVYCFTHQMEAMNIKPSSNVLEFEKKEMPKDLAQLFGVDETEQIFRFVRVRLADGVPLLLETTYMPVHIYPELKADMLREHSFYDILASEVNVIPYHAEETYENVMFEQSIIDILECAPHASGFYVERITRKEDGSVYEFTQSFMRGDRSKFVVKLQNNTYTFKRDIL
jgi:GntR family transcriptional regulator